MGANPGGNPARTDRSGCVERDVLRGRKREALRTRSAGDGRWRRSSGRGGADDSACGLLCLTFREPFKRLGMGLDDIPREIRCLGWRENPDDLFPSEQDEGG